MRLFSPERFDQVRDSRPGRLVENVVSMLAFLALLGGFLAIAGGLLFSSALWLIAQIIETVGAYLPRWLLGIVVWELVLVVGALLCMLRYTHRFLYGLAEMGMVVAATATAFSGLDLDALRQGNGTGMIAFGAAIYLAVRAFDNMALGLGELDKKTPQTEGPSAPS